MVATLRSRNRSTLVLIALGAIYLIWGSTYLSIRFAIETMPPYLMSGTRFIGAGLLLYFFLRMRGVEAPQLGHWKGATIVGALLLLGGNATVVWAETRVASSVAALLIATVPLWIVVLDRVWQRNHHNRMVWGGVLLGFVGTVVLVSQGGSHGSEFIDPIGSAALVLAALLWAIGSLYSRTANLPKSALMGTAMTMISGGIMVTGTGFLAGEWAQVEFAAISLKSALAWGYLMIFGSLIGLSCYTWLLRVTDAARVATYAYVNPVIAVFLGWFAAGETLSGRTILATIIIVAGVVLITSYSNKKKETVATEDRQRRRLRRKSGNTSFETSLSE